MSALANPIDGPEEVRQMSEALRPNEIAAQRHYSEAVADFGRGSAAADAARRHLLIIQRFNAVYGFKGY